MDKEAPLIRATRDQIKDFKESILWKDIKRELGIWKKAAKNEYGQVVGDAIHESLPSSKILMHLGSLYGREMTIDFLLGILDMFLQILEDKKDESRLESTD